MTTKKPVLSRRSLMTTMGLAAAAITVGPGRVFAKSGATAKLFYTDAGKGRRVMLLHGWTCDSHDWSWQLPVLESRYHVVAVDLRGHGRSEIMPAGGYGPADYVADIEALIETRFGGQSFTLIGHSMGGQIAARLAARRPDLVDAVISVDGALGLPDTLAPVFGKLVADLQAGDPGLVGSAFFENLYAPATDPALKRWHARRLQGMPQPPVRESFGPLFFGPDQVGLGKQSEAFCRTIRRPLYHLCRSQEQASRMRSWFSDPKSKVDSWSDAGHWVMQDRPAEVNAAILAWIDAL